LVVEQAALLVLGAILGTVLSLLAAVLYQDRLTRWTRRRKRRKESGKVFRSLETVGGAVVLAGHETRFHLVEGAEALFLDVANVETHLMPKLSTLPLEIQRRRASALASLGGAEAPDAQQLANWQSDDLVALSSYARRRLGPVEELGLVLDLRQVDYATYRATNLGLDVDLGDGTTLRGRYLEDEVDATRKPIGLLANGVGVSLAVHTVDGHMIMCRRRVGTFARPGEVDVGVTEGLHWGLDRRGERIDVIAGCLRGLTEELGVSASHEEIRLFGFGVDMDYYQWNFIGEADLEATKDQVVELHSRRAKDNWEGRLVTVPCDSASAFYRALGDEPMWSTAEVACYMSLCLRFGAAATLKALNEYRGLQ
jgi:hypothetical protein